MIKNKPVDAIRNFLPVDEVNALMSQFSMLCFAIRPDFFHDANNILINLLYFMVKVRL